MMRVKLFETNPKKIKLKAFQTEIVLWDVN